MAFDEKVGALWVEISAKKGNVADAFKSVRDDYDATTKKAQAYTAFMATGQGQEAARALEQSKAAASWAKLVAEQGRSGAMLTTIGNKLKTIKGNLDGFGNAPIIGFAAATASITALAAAASPATWQTFTGSWTLLSATIGTIFVPHMIEAARWIQTAARWFRELDPAIKSNIAGWAIAGVAATGFVVILSKMLGVVLMLGSAFRMLGLAGLFLNPVGAALGGAALGAGVAIGAGALADQVSPASSYRARDVAISRAPIPGNPDMHRSPELFTALMNRIFFTNPLSNIATGYREVHNQPSRSQVPGARELRPGEMGPPRPETSRPAGGGAGGGGWWRNAMQPDALMLGNNFQSQTYGIEEQGRRIQQQAASMSPLESAIERERSQQLNTLVNGVSEQGPIARFLERIEGILTRMRPGLGG